MIHKMRNMWVDFATVLEKFTLLACCNFVKNELILMSGRNVSRKESKQTKDAFPPHLTTVSVLPGKTGNCIFT